MDSGRSVRVPPEAETSKNQRIMPEMMLSTRHCLYDSVALGGGGEYEKYMSVW